MVPKVPFHQRSTAAQFHTAPKEFGDEVEYYFDDIDYEQRQLQEVFRKNVANVVDENPTLSTPEGKHMLSLINKVLNLELSASANGDPKEVEKLKRGKEKIKEYIDKVLDSVNDYIRTILHHVQASKGGNAQAMGLADNQRTQSHNGLINNLNILNRSLTWWFGDNFDPDDLRDGFRQMYNKQANLYISENIERTNIPENGICTASYNLSNRKSITVWAKNIFKDMIAVQKLSGLVDQTGDERHYDLAV